MAGSVEERGKNRWRLTYSMGLDENGKQIRKRKTVTAKNKTEAGKKLITFINEIETNNYTPTKRMKFKDFVKQWEDKYLSEETSNKTQEVYGSIVKSHLIPYLGNKFIEDIDPLLILQYMKDLTKPTSRQSKSRAEGGLSSGTRQQHYFVLRSIFKRAVDWQVLNSNPMTRISKPVLKREQREVYNLDDIKALFKAIQDEPFEKFILIKFTLFTGMRRGEVSGVQWSDIDFETGVLDIQHALYYTTKKGYYLDDTKNASSKRKVQLSPSLIDDLKKLQEQQNKIKPAKKDQWEKGRYNFIFVNDENFKPYFPLTISKWFRRFLKRKNLKHITFHDLRHTLATLLINKGVHAKVISNILGHSNIQTTMNIYGHVLKEAEMNVASGIDDMLAADATFSKSIDED
jgi:integrase